MCPNCERPDCKHFLGGRSEVAYQDCIAYTAGRANMMRDAIHRIHETNLDWASVWTWMDKHRDPIVKNIVDANGRYEIKIAVLEKQLADTEADLERAMREIAERL